MSRSKTVGALLLSSACTLLLNARPASAQDFGLYFRDGLVTLVARDVTVPTILTSWARIGNVTVVNGDKIDSAPVTLQLVNVPEREALAVLLRNAGGYILAARQEGDQRGVSVFDRILVVAPSAVRNSSPQLAAQLAPPPSSVESAETRPGIANQSAEPIGVFVAPPNAAAAGAAPFAFSGPGPFAPPGNPKGPAGASLGAGLGTARPGEVVVPPPPTRISPGPPRPQQQH